MIFPLFCTLNLVVPELDAAIRSPELMLLTIREALLPIPPDIERGAGVFEEAPIRTAVSKSDERIRFPVPFAVKERLSFETVDMVEAAPPPTLMVGLLSARVPVVAPIAIVVAAPPMLREVAFVLNREAVVVVVVMSALVAPLTERSPLVVTSPVRRDVPSIVSVPFACMLPAFERVVPDAPYPPPRIRESIVVTASEALMAVAAVAFTVVAFERVKVRLLTVAVPVDAPRERVVAAPPIFRVVALVLNREAVVVVVVMSALVAPLTARSPAVVI